LKGTIKMTEKRTVIVNYKITETTRRKLETLKDFGFSFIHSVETGIDMLYKKTFKDGKK
jgi:hypothetical protein